MRFRVPKRGRRSSSLVGLVLLFTAFAIMNVAGAGAVVAGAGFTTTNAAVDGQGTCFNGPGVVNCNIYQEKEHVWINGGPTRGANSLSDGTYFFVVGVPGGENSDINDVAIVPDDGTGTTKNLSDDFDAYTNRTFTVSGGKDHELRGHPRQIRHGFTAPDPAVPVLGHDEPWRRVLRRYLPDRHPRD
jgi:hypothetical protein